MQRMSPKACVKGLAYQDSILHSFKLRGSLCHYPNQDKWNYDIGILVYYYAGSCCDSAHQSFIYGILVGKFEKDAVFHPVTWKLHKSARPVRSVGAAEILEYGEAIVEGKIMEGTMSTLLGAEVQVIVALYLKDMFDSISTQRGSIHKIIRPDVAVIRCKFKFDAVRMFVWIPKKENLANNGSKDNSPLVDALRLMLATGQLPLESVGSITRSSDCLIGSNCSGERREDDEY